MKIITALLAVQMVCFLSGNDIQAQFVTKSHDDELFQQLLKSKKTYVLLTGMEEFDNLMTEAMKESWKITPFEAISKEEMFEKLYDPSFSFLLPAAFTTTVTNGHITSRVTDFGNKCIAKKPTDTRHKDDPKYIEGLHDLQRGYDGFLAVVMGGPKKYNMGDMIAFCPFEVEEGFAQGTNTLMHGMIHQRYRLKDMVTSLHHSIELVRDNQYSFADNNCVRFFLDKYDENALELKNKTLYVLDSDFKRTPDLKKSYPYKIKMVEYEEFAAAISEGTEGIVYLLVTRNAPGGMYLFDPHAHKILGGRKVNWSDFNVSNMKIDDGDLKDIAKIVGN